MTKVRTAEECLIVLQAESAWRKKEISTLRATIDQLTQAEHDVLTRSAVVMVYAHWEGFVKKACELYINHINERISRHTVTLSDHFLMILMWKEFRKRGEHPFWKNPAPYIEATRTYFEGRTDKDTLPLDGIDTESNLSSKVLKKLMVLIDIDYTFFQTKEKLIDECLLDKRNRIAHGERITIKQDDYKTIEAEVRGLMDIFQSAIEKCVQQEKYKSPSAKYLGIN